MTFDPKTREKMQAFKDKLPKRSDAELKEFEWKACEEAVLKKTVHAGGKPETPLAPVSGGVTPSPAPAVGVTRDQYDFYNPYHFVPVFNADKARWVDKTKLTDDNRTHSRYQPLSVNKESGLTGRLICKLTTINPVFIGAERVKDATAKTPAELKHFEIKDGEPAIPASTLRGLISSIAEAASNSAMRVLTDRVLSYRKARAPKITLSALGMVIEENEAYRLRPLVMPTLIKQDKNGYILPQGEGYEKIFIEPRLKVYVGNYQGENNMTPCAFLFGKKSFDIYKPEYYYLKLKKDWIFISGVLKTHGKLRVKNGFVIGQTPDNGNVPISEQELNAMVTEGTAEKDDYVRGILRILGKDGRGMPSGKKHELFIPYPEGAEKWESFPIPERVVNRFHLLADERAEATKKEKNHHPYEPRGKKRTDVNLKNEKLSTLRLKHGDIVYFKPSSCGTQIEEVAFSSIWRGAVLDDKQTATVRHFFDKTVDPELLPFNKERKMISPAELLFGFVQEDGKRTKKKGCEAKEGLAYAGRLRFSFGMLGKKPKPSGGYYEAEVPLKILSSPKPPCPAMYFMNKKNGSGVRPTSFIPKDSLNPTQHEPQGRKFYLHRQESHKQAIAAEPPWKTACPEKDAMQKVSICPMKPELNFYFHVDFDNLTEWELGLLCYSLKPDDAFMHKLGMGKSIGLGKVEITPKAVFLVDRVKRYTEDGVFSAGRYHDARSKIDLLDMNDWPVGYKQEVEFLNSHTAGWDFAAARDVFAVTMNADIKQALALLGDPVKIDCPVHTPQVRGMSIEEKTFTWFMRNESSKAPQSLEPLNSGSIEIKPLKKI